MGRGRIELKKIENVNRLQVSFTNRRKVLMKKANDLSILCSLLSSSPTPARTREDLRSVVESIMSIAQNITH
ncbi:hypothetical protein YC2023_094971 [Brassica napus]